MIQDILPRFQEVANGTKTAFTVPFDIIDEQYLLVYLGSERKESGWTVTGNSITFGTAPDSGTKVTILRALPISWENDDYGVIGKGSLSNICSYLVGKMQTLEEQVSRSYKVPVWGDVSDNLSSEQLYKELQDALTALENAKNKLDQIEATIEQGLSDITSEKDGAISDINENASDRIGEFNQNVENKSKAFEERANEAVEDFNVAAENKKKELNGIADSVKESEANAKKSADSAAESAKEAEEIVASGKFLDTTRISNCIIEAPHKFEIRQDESGDPYLVPGGKVPYANGNTYIEVEVNNETASSIKWTVKSPSDKYVFITPPGYRKGYIVAVEQYLSGTELPSSNPNPTKNTYFYNATTNQGYLMEVGKTSWSNFGYSYPLALIEATSNNSASITKITPFNNGIGVVGHHIYALPGIKVLVPQGKNEDGTLRSIKSQTEAFLLFEMSSGMGGGNLGRIISFNYTTNGLEGHSGASIVNTEGEADETTYVLNYIKDSNVTKRWFNNKWNYEARTFLARFQQDNGILKYFEPFTPIRFDYQKSGVDSQIVKEVDALEARVETIEDTLDDLDGKFVTTDTKQTISGDKTYTGQNVYNQRITLNNTPIAIKNSENREALYKQSAIEFKPLSTENHGGYIDFHYAGSDEDYTARLIEDEKGKIRFYGEGAFSESTSVGDKTLATKGWVNIKDYAVKSTTLSGYGITDTYTKSEIDGFKFVPKSTADSLYLTINDSKAFMPRTEFQVVKELPANPVDGVFYFIEEE